MSQLEQNAISSQTNDIQAKNIENCIKLSVLEWEDWHEGDE